MVKNGIAQSQFSKQHISGFSQSYVVIECRISKLLSTTSRLFKVFCELHIFWPGLYIFYNKCHYTSFKGNYFYVPISDLNFVMDKKANWIITQFEH